ncbi:MAG: hypothetical protein QXP58_01120 [Thermoprotei archaeon]
MAQTKTILEARESHVVDSSRRLVRIGLGALWLFDGLLQLQPQMFTSNFPINVVGQAIQGLPNPIYKYSLSILEGYIIPYIVAWNAFFASLQLLIGALILSKSTKQQTVGLTLSIVWSIILWVFGEGLGGIYTATMSGGIFPGTPSLFNGFPGAALIYAWSSITLLLPERAWRLSGRFSPIRDGAALIFAVSALIQLQPLMWTAYGQASIFAANLDNLPTQLWFTVEWLARYSVSHPVAANTFEVVALFVAAIGVWGITPKKWGYIYAITLLGFTWWFSLGLGGLLTGLGTDPNTPPLIVLLMVPYILWCNAFGRKR